MANVESHRATLSLSVEKFEDATCHEVTDTVAVEEPLEIRLDYRQEEMRQQKSISITMRTPGHDFELAAGFLFTEGIVQNRGHILEISHCGPLVRTMGHSNVVKLILSDATPVDMQRLERHFYTSSSCGVCGKSSIDALKTQSIYPPLDAEHLAIDPRIIHRLPDRLRVAQEVFEQTGGLHASALFTTEGELKILREDVGRHNALDKVIGAAFLNSELPLSTSILMVSGRVSFELVQKAAMAGIRVLVAVGAPSSLAVALANENDMTLLGFVRGGRFNVYTGLKRIQRLA